MSLAPLPRRGLRFYSAFHRYNTLLSTPSHHTYPHQPSFPSTLTSSAPRHLSTSPPHPTNTTPTSTSTSPPTTTTTPPTTPPKIPPTHYHLFPSTFPHGPPPLSPFTLTPATLLSLKKEYHNLQRHAHPDHHHTPPTKRAAEARSAHIGTAYRTLLDPLLRAEYLLSLRGMEIEEGGMGGEVDAGLLGEVMEIREEIEGAEGEEVERLKGENEERIREVVGGLGRMVEMEDWGGVRGGVVRLRFWYSVRESLAG